MESNPDIGGAVKKPTGLVPRIIKLIGFRNPEDLIYRFAQDYFQYMNYGMFPENGSSDYDGYSEEAVNYLELFGLYRPNPGKNLDIMEIGGGFGYGAKLIYEEFKPRYLLCIDKAPNAILYAKSNLVNTTVTYKIQDFSDITEPDNSFNVIYTVESGGSFPKQKHFDIAYRLLKKDGIFLVANINSADGIATKREFAKKAGFQLHSEKDVTQQVLSYLNSEKKSHKFYSVIDSMPFHKFIICKLFMKSVKEFARMPGSKTNDLIGSKEFYYHFCFKK